MAHEERAGHAGGSSPSSAGPGHHSMGRRRAAPARRRRARRASASHRRIPPDLAAPPRREHQHDAEAVPRVGAGQAPRLAPLRRQSLRREEVVRNGDLGMASTSGGPSSPPPPALAHTPASRGCAAARRCASQNCARVTAREPCGTAAAAAALASPGKPRASRPACSSSGARPRRVECVEEPAHRAPERRLLRLGARRLEAAQREAGERPQRPAGPRSPLVRLGQQRRRRRAEHHCRPAAGGRGEHGLPVPRPCSA
ncbi:unnamed protein product [Prorocentrum cordatum]|uniref:Uncharacterized protein n=1 Tax=Prorocentrum cordatum TaxID=2364126 RepID=A0ABN9S4P3_9DINO|nr:unnamed protein product [Polarella glacialis]